MTIRSCLFIKESISTSLSFLALMSAFSQTLLGLQTIKRYILIELNERVCLRFNVNKYTGSPPTARHLTTRFIIDLINVLISLSNMYLDNTAQQKKKKIVSLYISLRISVISSSQFTNIFMKVLNWLRFL